MYSQHDSSGASAQILTILKPETATFLLSLGEVSLLTFFSKESKPPEARVLPDKSKFED